MSQPKQSWLRRYRWQFIIASIVVVLAVASAITYTVYSRSLPPQIQGVNCGYISSTGFGPGRNDTGTVRKVGDCFWQAYQQCRTATMQVTSMGVDTGSTDTLVVNQQQGSCGIKDSSQFYSANFGGSHSQVNTSTCSKLVRQGARLLFSGCKADFGSNQVSDSFTVSLEADCGYVENQTQANFITADENCFAQSAQQCHAAIMHYIPNTAGVHRSYAFTVNEPSCSITDTTMDTQSGQTVGTYTCAAVAQRQDGLHFSSCGKDGDIVVPLSFAK